jgi:HK97 family phage major capsid protein
MNGTRQKYNGMIQEIGTLNAEVTKLFNASDEKGGQDTVLDIDRIKDLNKKIEEKQAAAADLLEVLNIRDGAEARDRDLKVPATKIYHSDGSTVDVHIGEKAQDVASTVMNDPEFKDWFQKIAPNGHISRNKAIQSPAVQVGGMKALITGLSSTSAGAFVVNDRLSTVDQGTFYRPLKIFDLITRGTTNSDVVEYVRQGTHTNAAEPVAEATATSDGTGAKPESSMALSVVTETVKTIAHWVAATNRALSDAGQLRTIIEQFLRYGLLETLEEQILEGDGAGENFTGIMNTTGTSTQAYDTSLLKTTRLARTKVMTSGRAQPTAWVMNPTDWQTFDLLVDNETRYYFGGPMQLGTPRLWGLPVVESDSLTAGYGIVADWRLAVLWDREQATITASNSHSDFFIRNLVAILAEMRAAFGVLRPAAFVETDLTP